MASKSRRSVLRKCSIKEDNIDKKVDDEKLRQKFVLALEKPSQVYRLLCTRSILSPLFLTRTLWYMKHRTSRNNKARATFKVNDILARKLEEQKTQKPSNRVIDEFQILQMTFLRYFNELEEMTEKYIKVRVVLKKVHHIKRNDLVPCSSEIKLCTVVVPVNISQEKSKWSVIELPSHLFSLDATTKSHVLLFKLKSQTTTGGILKLCAELPINEKNTCSLVNGEYELLLNNTEVADKSNRAWSHENNENFNMENYGNHFKRGPLIQLRISWSKKLDKLQQSHASDPCNETRAEGIEAINVDGKDNIVNKENLGLLDIVSDFKVAFVFEVNGKSWSFDSEAKSQFACPWCHLECRHLYPLLKHLTLCHPRLCFTLKHENDINIILVSINKFYDGSYVGNHRDLIAQPPNKGFSRGGVQWRTSFTEVIVVHPKHCPPNIAEFHNPIEKSHMFIRGHNRTYFNSETRLPLTKSEEKESENENIPETDPEWIYKLTSLEIADFKDLNDGEKQIMTMWNQHMLEHNYVAQFQMKDACLSFVHSKGCEIISMNLYRNFILHLTCLFDFHILCADDLYTVVCALHQTAAKMQ